MACQQNDRDISILHGITYCCVYIANTANSLDENTCG
jgi:hypothetical protein